MLVNEVDLMCQERYKTWSTADPDSNDYFFILFLTAELGDHDSRRHSSGYISEFRFIANQSPELENRISELHKSMA